MERLFHEMYEKDEKILWWEWIIIIPFLPLVVILNLFEKSDKKDIQLMLAMVSFFSTCFDDFCK